jgi:hypothetical protein
MIAGAFRWYCARSFPCGEVYRTKENDPNGEQAWRPLRKGVADLHRRATVCQAANDRYAEALAAVQDATPLKEWAEPLCRRASAPGNNPQERKVRALNPLAAAAAALLAGILDPRFTVNGLRNRDVVALLYPQPATDPQQQRRRSGQATRLLRLLRGTGCSRRFRKRTAINSAPTHANGSRPCWRRGMPMPKRSRPLQLRISLPQAKKSKNRSTETERGCYPVPNPAGFFTL